jgi:hypothetical protein
VAGHERRLEAVHEDFVAGQGRAEDRRLCPAGSILCALEEVVGDLRARELGQVGTMGLHEARHIRGLASLAGKEQRYSLGVESHT